jgi:hypothetical protein
MPTEVCSPLNKKATPLPHPDKNARNPRHRPVYGPPATGGGGGVSSSPAISAAISVRTGGRDLSNPDPFEPPGRPG